ncbi:class I SAM-dependent methyltransferase [Prolixibacteraceae bacterium Z1-6]|uniref:Class I SAM-dependent methyltransferase n=1 Tax=Draconibacterium aestuarii TaxID=2998507 RepID=A0A9X3F1F1_9BACT|nr:class I SAM-dependent methyltransferase [Prolixibacteraceae bacterium Z1-6]
MKTKKRTIGVVVTGTEHETIPNLFFRMMSFTMKIADLFGNYSNKNFNTLNLQKGQVVVDYGCGPARYIKNASEAVGTKGKVLAVDIHPLAIKNVEQIAKKYGLKNVEAFLADDYSCAIPNNTADVVYALDMFHMIEQPVNLLTELARIVKPDGSVIIEDGHQPRVKTIFKITDSGLFNIVNENKHHVVCIPKG